MASPAVLRRLPTAAATTTTTTTSLGCRRAPATGQVAAASLFRRSLTPGLALRAPGGLRKGTVAVPPRASLSSEGGEGSNSPQRNPATRAAASSDIAGRIADDVELTFTDSSVMAQELQDELAKERLLRRERRQREQKTYKLAAIAASTLLVSTAVFCTWYRFTLHTGVEEFPVMEFGLTLLLVLGGMFGMEMYARYAHRILWHEFQPGWALHKSHHEPRTGPFEANDIYAVANALPAMVLCAYGFFTPGVVGGISFGLGLGITLFGISYMFVHDGMIHRRFPVGPIAELPYLKRVAMAHQIHHSERFGGVPYGLFFGPQELEAIGGGEYLDELLEKQADERAAAGSGSSSST